MLTDTVFIFVFLTGVSYFLIKGLFQAELESRQTSILFAVADNNITKTKMFLENGASARDRGRVSINNEPYFYLATPIEVAAYNNNTEMAILLLQYGADNLVFPLTMTVDRDNLELVKLFYSPEMVAISNDKTIQYLIEHHLFTPDQYERQWIFNRAYNTQNEGLVKLIRSMD